MSRALGTAVALALVAAPATALAHTQLTSPIPRVDNDGLKSGPCGGVAPTGVPMQASPGETITVSWLETVNHPGYYRLAFSMGNDEGFDDNILADDIADVDCTATPCSYTQDVTLPNVECEGCSLQLIQYMGTQPPYRPYFSCADVDLIGVGGSPDAGMGGNEGGADGGCQIGHGAANSGLGTLFFVCLVLGISRRCRK